MDDLRRIDLNLLLTLHALLAEKHVTRAALRLHKSQPAVSHALAQLRDIFQDPLLLRRGSAMALTPRAQELVQPLQTALSQLNGLLQTEAFDPSQASRCFRLGLSDYAARLILPPLLRRLRQQAPGVDLAATQASRQAMLTELLDGELDLALGVFPQVPSALQTETLFHEHFISVADHRSLNGARRLDLTQWLARPHVLVAMRPDAPNEIDNALAAQGLQRHIALVLPHWSACVGVLPGTDLLLTVASRTLEGQPRQRGLHRFAPPIPLPGFAFQQAWHARREADPAHLWLRRLVHQCSQPTTPT